MEHFYDAMPSALQQASDIDQARRIIADIEAKNASQSIELRRFKWWRHDPEYAKHPRSAARLEYLSVLAVEMATYGLRGAKARYDAGVSPLLAMEPPKPKGPQRLHPILKKRQQLEAQQKSDRPQG